MSSAAKAAFFVIANLWLTGCYAGQQEPRIALGDLEDYKAFLEDRGDDHPPEPFEPEPLLVSAIGKVQAKPDIAVITATISAEDKNESRAVNEMGQIINAVQNALQGRNVETGFTAITSSRKFDERCQNDNRFAQRRHNQIRSDYFFNKRLDDRGDTETKRRDPKPRVAQKTCFAQRLKVSTEMVIRIKPAKGAGDVLRALSDAGAENSRLYGYDFADYDALYQEASQKAVRLAREKAKAIADKAGGTLGEIESFSVSAPERTGRFGPQPNIIRPANRYRGPEGSVIDRYIDQNIKALRAKRYRDDRNASFNAFSSPPALTFEETPRFTCWDGSIVYNSGQCVSLPNQDSVPNQGSVAVQELVTIPPTYETIYENGIARRVQKTPASTQERVLRPNANTNALSISLLSGPQTISVTANLGYTYDTPLNGKIIIIDDEEN